MAKLNEKKQLFAEGKALGKTNRELTKELCITEKTASVWAKDPRVQAKITELQVENWSQAQGLLISIQSEAIGVLSKLLDSEDDRIRIKAACTLLSLCASFPQYLE